MLSVIKAHLGLLLFLAAGCGGERASRPLEDQDRITQVSLINALMLGQYDGVTTLGELLRYGNFGLGTCDHLDGELIVLDGVAYQVKSDGTVVELDPQSTTPFAVITPFENDGACPCPKTSSLEELEERLDNMLSAKNLFFALRVEAEMESITLRSVPRQEPPYAPLADVAKQQAVWSHENVTGTLVGIRSPKWTSGISVPGYHWHFLSSDHKIGGHVLNCTIRQGTIAYDQCDSLLIKLNDSDGKDLSQNLSRELEEVESLRGVRKR